MAIVSHEHSDITSSGFHCDIIIGMNQELQDVRGIGRRVLQGYEPLRKLPLGSVITFPWDKAGRELHLLICHKLGEGGWERAEQHVRYGLDYLNHKEGRSERGHGIVEIGKGRVGKRDGADPTLIHQAIADSWLPVTLFIFDPPDLREAVSGQVIPIRPSSTWSMETGERSLLAA